MVDLESSNVAKREESGVWDSVVLRKSQVVAQEVQTSSTPLDRLGNWWHVKCRSREGSMARHGRVARQQRAEVRSEPA